jgi:hypothetical protein
VLAVVAAGIVATAGSATPRSGALDVTKECSQYTFAARSFCTITSSNVNAIKPGYRVGYASAADFARGVLDSDLAVHGLGNNTAFGHVVLNLSTLSGTVTLSGGTGELTHFHAGPIAVACPAYPDCSWTGPYSFTGSGDELGGTSVNGKRVLGATIGALLALLIAGGIAYATIPGPGNAAGAPQSFANYASLGIPPAIGKACDLGGRVKEQAGLYVVDGSLIEGSTGFANPSLTIAALAERCMETA